MGEANLISTQTIHLPSDFLKELKTLRKTFLTQNEVQLRERECFAVLDRLTCVGVRFRERGCIGKDHLGNILRSGLFGTQSRPRQRAQLNVNGDEGGIIMVHPGQFWKQ